MRAKNIAVSIKASAMQFECFVAACAQWECPGSGKHAPLCEMPETTAAPVHTSVCPCAAKGLTTTVPVSVLRYPYAETWRCVDTKRSFPASLEGRWRSKNTRTWLTQSVSTEGEVLRDWLVPEFACPDARGFTVSSPCAEEPRRGCDPSDLLMPAVVGELMVSRTMRSNEQPAAANPGTNLNK